MIMMSQHPDNRETGYSNVLGLCGTAAGGCSANYGESLGGPLRQHPHSPQDDDCDDGDDDDGDDDDDHHHHHPSLRLHPHCSQRKLRQLWQRDKRYFSISIFWTFPKVASTSSSSSSLTPPQMPDEESTWAHAMPFPAPSPGAQQVGPRIVSAPLVVVALLRPHESALCLRRWCMCPTCCRWCISPT